MVQPPAPRLPATYADLEALPDHVVGEILRGSLHASPRPGPRHARAASRLGALVGPPFDLGRGGPGGWWILDEPELHLGPDVVVPDLAGWRREHLPRLPDTAFIALAPDWVAEILSPATARIDRGEKLAIYHRERVGHVWLMDPIEGTLEVLRHATEGLLLVGVHVAPAVAQVEPFGDVELALGLLFGEDR